VITNIGTGLNKKMVYSVGLGGEFDSVSLEKISGTKVYAASDKTQLESEFIKIRTDLMREINSLYYLHYTSPKRGDVNHELIISIVGNLDTLGNAQDTGYFNSKYFSDSHPAQARNMEIELVSDSLYGSYDYWDSLGFAEGNSEVRWLRDGVQLEEYDSMFVIPKDSEDVKGTRYTFEVLPKHKYHEPILGQLGFVNYVTGHIPTLKNLSVINKDTTRMEAFVGDTLILSYDFQDGLGHAEGSPVVEWYRGDEMIVGESSAFYKVKAQDALTILRVVLRVTDESGNESESETASKSIVGNMVDSRDGKTYRAVLLGSKVWMSENLNYGDFVSDGNVATTVQQANQKFCKDNLESGCTQGGGLYQWHAVMALNENCHEVSCGVQVQAVHRGICPESWHVPTKSEWDELQVELGGALLAGEFMKQNSTGYSEWDGSFNNGGENYGFAAYPNGSRHGLGGFVNAGYKAYFWEATENIGTVANHRMLSSGNKNLTRDLSYKKYGYSLRCVRD
jgi:uncharacterized protein (TIGR02145 family)